MNINLYKIRTEVGGLEEALDEKGLKIQTGVKGSLAFDFDELIDWIDDYEEIIINENVGDELKKMIFKNKIARFIIPEKGEILEYKIEFKSIIDLALEKENDDLKELEKNKSNSEES